MAGSEFRGGRGRMIAGRGGAGRGGTGWGGATRWITGALTSFEEGASRALLFRGVGGSIHSVY